MSCVTLSLMRTYTKHQAEHAKATTGLSHTCGSIGRLDAFYRAEPLDSDVLYTCRFSANRTHGGLQAAGTYENAAWLCTGP
jgi:hypothetical protein